jgi:hypothetical protein
VTAPTLTEAMISTARDRCDMLGVRRMEEHDADQRPTVFGRSPMYEE